MAVERVVPVFEDNPYVDEIIIFNERGQHKSIIAKLRFIATLRKKKFDTVFLVQRSFTRALICLCAGIRSRIGYRRSKYLTLVNRQISPPTGILHRQDHYLYLFEQSGIAIKDKNPQFFLTDEVRSRVKARLENLRARYPRIIGVHPSANWLLKRWPAENFAQLCDRIIEQVNCSIVFIGAQADSATVENVIASMKNVAHNFCGATTLKELGALLENMSMFISNDSGPAHLAAALGIETLVLFGPTSDVITGPRGKSVRILKKDVRCDIPCYNLVCEDNRCMKGILVEDVIKQVLAILSKDTQK